MYAINDGIFELNRPLLIISQRGSGTVRSAVSFGLFFSDVRGTGVNAFDAFVKIPK